MRITEEIRIFWGELTGWQQVKICGIAGIVLIVMLSGFVDSCSSMREVRKLEREAATAKRGADEAIAAAARIAAELRAAQEAVRALEELRNAKANELEEAKRNSGDALDNYNRVRQQPRTDSPDADTLCRELADLGYPCK